MAAPRGNHNRLIDMSGKRFGSLLVGERHGTSNGSATWSCLCDCCGRTVIKTTYDLRRGATFCDGRENSRKAGKAANAARTAATLSVGWLRFLPRGAENPQTPCILYRRWIEMRFRCRDKTNPHYGGRGISVCREWSRYPAFRAWAIATGFRKELTIERIDNDLGYSPSNCRWATMAEQNANHRNTVKIDGAVASVIAEKNGISRSVFWNRVIRGWDKARACTQPPREYRRATTI